MFLLAAVGELRIRTTYDLKEEVALQPGSIRESISRLMSQGYLVRPAAKARGRRPMELTESGKKHLREHWAEGLNPDKEVESVVRSAALAMTMADASATSAFLREAASSRERHSGPTQVDPVSLRKGAIAFHRE